MSGLTSIDIPVIEQPRLSAREFDQIRKLAYEHFGLELRDGKEQLVSARLAKLLRELKLKSFQQYYDYLLADRSGEALTAMIDALTTNHTSFFREPDHFDFLRSTILPQISNRIQVDIWSAACSTGEEPYSIAFSLMRHFEQQRERRSIRILATDISTRVLATARRAAYPEERFSNFPLESLRPFLLRGVANWNGWYRIKPQVRDQVEFRRLNLMENFSHIGSFPVIFCRNVMIYFDKATQESLVNRLADRLEPGGYLLIGHSESLNRINHGLRYIQPAIYQKPGGGSPISQRGYSAK
ncbi:MAG TPA: protein-glutamate O-methyltransferase CheR [Bryobacteraceae bacterium]|nr:protein-glutamate O-methyltransferase CheR [Bryobacteraceae bacterium]